jgi:hypothetical protein
VRSRERPDLVWQRSYERASFERLLAPAQAERERRLADLHEAQRRLDAAGAALTAPNRAGRALALVLSAHRQIVHAQRAHEHAIDTIHGEATAEAERLLAAAQNLVRPLHGEVTLPRLAPAETLATEVVEGVVGPLRAELAELGHELRKTAAYAAEAEAALAASADDEEHRFLVACLAQKIEAEQARFQREERAAREAAVQHLRIAFGDAAALIAPASPLPSGQRRRPAPTSASGCSRRADRAIPPLVEGFRSPGGGNGSSEPRGRGTTSGGSGVHVRQPFAGDAPGDTPRVEPRAELGATVAEVAPRPQRTTRPRWRHLLHADVILPLVVVLLVATFLLALLG